MKILAVIVTHNRRDLLGRCLDHVLSQGRGPDSILVINNASSDGTVEMLERRGVKHVTQPNLGSAGGWHRGIQAALQEGFDAVWLMDDDGFPGKDALGHLEKSLVPGVACASSVVLREDDPARFVFPFPVLSERGLPVLLGRPRKVPTLAELKGLAVDGRYPFAHLFNGALVSVEAIRRIGNVDQDFFMFGDEVDYFFRLRLAGRVVSVLAAPHFHPDVSARPYTPAKVYYYVKNTLILNRRYFDSVGARNCAAVLAVLARTARRNGPLSALSLVAGRQAPSFYKGIVRGLQGRVAKDFDD